MADSEVIERVARTMFQRFHEIGAKLGISAPPIPWEDAIPEWREAWLEAARAAISAMREPSMPMLHAAYSLMDGQPECKCLNPGLVFEWRTMIDEALK